MGRGVVCWRGEPDASTGEYLVEWTVDPDLVWGGDITSSAGGEAVIEAKGGRVLQVGVFPYEL